MPVQRPSIAGLIQFIATQPADRVVRHNSWSACAVGDYGREVCNWQVSTVYTQMVTDPVLGALWLEAGTYDSFGAAQRGQNPDTDVTPYRTIMDYLNEGGHGCAPETYGGLFLVIQAQFPGLVQQSLGQ